VSGETGGLTAIIKAHRADAWSCSCGWPLNDSVGSWVDHLAEQIEPLLAPEQAVDLLTVLIADHPMWIGDDGRPLHYLPERESRITDFCREFAAALRPDPSGAP
jgi:hypothetical protein